MQQKIVAHSTKKQKTTYSKIDTDFIKITQKNEQRMRDMISQAKEIEKSGKTSNFENLRQCRFCYEEQYLNDLERR